MGIVFQPRIAYAVCWLIRDNTFHLKWIFGKKIPSLNINTIAAKSAIPMSLCNLQRLICEDTKCIHAKWLCANSIKPEQPASNLKTYSKI